ncbi:ABC1 kinase family protein [Micromonospora sp. DT201]
MGSYLIIAVIFVGLYAAIAIGARQLLGLRVRPMRMFLAAAVSWVSSTLIIGYVGPPERQSILFSVVLGLSLLITMVFLAVAELVLPHGLRPAVWKRQIHHEVRRVRRYRQVARIASRYRLARLLLPIRGDRVEVSQERARRAIALRRALEECGVTLVKLGQALSARHDLLPAEYITELSRLHDQVRPSPWPEIEAVLTEDLGAAAEEVFLDFEPKPIAAASIAQVHRARLRSGVKVAVKVRRPGVAAIVEDDLAITRHVARIIESRTEWGRTIGAAALAEGFATALREELDFQIEAQNIATITASAKARPGSASVRLPAVHTDYSSARVLVMEFLEGVPVGAAAELLNGGDVERRHKLAASLMSCILEQILVSGTFHCDPHPGNVLIMENDECGLLDFGVVGRFDPAMRDAVQQLLLAIDRTDRAGACDALLDILENSDSIDSARLEVAVGQFMARHLGAGRTPGLDTFAALFQLVTIHGLRVPPEVAAMFRTLTTLQGTIDRIDPRFNLLEEARDFAAGHYSEATSFSKITTGFGEDLFALLPSLRRLPRRMDRISAALEQGRLSVGVQLFAHERDRNHVTGLVHQTLLAFLAAATGVMAALLLSSTGGPPLTPDLQLFHVFGYNLLIISAVLMLRALVRIFRREP